MDITDKQQVLLRELPGVDHILSLVRNDNSFENIPKSVLVKSIRKVIDDFRKNIIAGSITLSDKNASRRGMDDTVMNSVRSVVRSEMALNLRRVVNATGIIIHTNLGRSLLPSAAVEHITAISDGYSNLEFNLETGKRGIRYSCVEDLLCELSGAEAALVVNNNAGAVLLCLETLAKGKEVIVSRGELVEIGGSFRIPDVMSKSGCKLIEAGTTNRTHVSDYEAAVNDDTALLLKVHKSNYSMIGFTADVSLEGLVELGGRHKIPVMEDLGSGTFIDFSKYGLIKEPTVQESVASRVDVVTFSGDKLLGGPQAGIIVGKKEILDKIKKNPLTRALRIDKLTLAALESTLRLYRDEEKAVQQIPTLSMMTMRFDVLEKKAKHLAEKIEALNGTGISVTLLDLPSKTGGGALPLMDLPSKCVGLKINGMSANAIEIHMRKHSPPVIGRIEDDFFIMDMRTIRDDEVDTIVLAVKNMLQKGNP